MEEKGGSQQSYQDETEQLSSTPERNDKYLEIKYVYHPSQFNREN